jgi:hypothetical protein
MAAKNTYMTTIPIRGYEQCITTIPMLQSGYEQYMKTIDKLAAMRIEATSCVVDGACTYPLIVCGACTYPLLVSGACTYPLLDIEVFRIRVRI